MTDARIVVGYDEREPARDALALARELSDVTGDELLLVAVLPYDPTYMGEELFERFLVEDAERVFAPAKKALGDLAETRAIGSRSPARILHEIAEDEPASIVVVGSTERGAIGRVLPGSVGERLLHGSPCPVAIAPRGFAEREVRSLQHFGIAFDGSRQSWAALEFARELAARVRAKVDLIGALRPWASNAPVAFRFAELSEIADIDEVDAGRQEDLERVLADGLRELPEAIRGRSKLRVGEPVEEIAEWAEAESIDLLISGSRGYGAVARVLLGGVSSALARSAPVPYLVVPRVEH